MAKRGYRVGPRRVRRLARAAGLSCVHPKPYKVTTVQDEANGDGLVDLVGPGIRACGVPKLGHKP
jgi:putative transposase